MRVAGIAYFENRRLKAAGLLRNDVLKEQGPTAWNGMGRAAKQWVTSRTGSPAVTKLVVEVPQIYRSSPKAWTLIELAGVDGAVSMAITADHWVGYQPRIWKGQQDKAEHHATILELLTPDELEAIEACPAGLRHNVLDAIALGMYELGR